MPWFRFEVLREERLHETADVDVEADTVEEAAVKLEQHFEEAGNENDPAGEEIDWRFVDQSTIATEVDTAGHEIDEARSVFTLDMTRRTDG